MTTEEKAKAYDDALERARKIHNEIINNEILGFPDQIREIFPQLRESESEDERIINAIIGILKNSNAIDINVSQEKMLSWLEKQKEQKELPLMDGNADLYFDEWNQQKQNPTKRQCFEEGIRYARRLQKEQKPVVTHGETYHVDTLGTQQVIAGKMPQKPELVQQPPITYTYNSNASRDERLKAALLALLNSDLLKVKEGGYFTKQDLIEWVERIPTDKPAEWSEEDEKIMDSIINELGQHYKTCTSRDCPSASFSFKAYQKEIDWLKSLRPQPQQNMSIGFMLYLDEHRPDGKMCLSNAECNEIETAFKNQSWDTILRYVEKYQPHWKPSEEHLSALLAIFNDPNNIGSQTCQLALTDLYEQLKKLT